MRFRVDCGVLADAVTWTARALPVRPAAPILAGMVLDVTDRLRLSSFDYEISALASVDVDVEETGRVLVPGKLLSDIMRNLPQRTVEMAFEDSHVVVRCGSATFTLLTMPDDSYPTLPELPPVKGTVATDDFARAVSQVVVAASRDDTVPVLTGMKLEIEGDIIRLVCTDRYRLAVRELRWQPEQPDLSVEALVPARTLANLAKSLPSGGRLALALADTTEPEGGLVGFEYEGRRTTTRLLSEQFIKYQSYLSLETRYRAEIETAPLVEAVKRVALVAERNVPVRLSFSQDEVVLDVTTGETAKAQERVAAKFDGDDVSMGFNPQYILDALSASESETVVLQFKDTLKPTLVTGLPPDGEQTSDYRHIVMPVRL